MSSDVFWQSSVPWLVMQSLNCLPEQLRKKINQHYSRLNRINEWKSDEVGYLLYHWEGQIIARVTQYHLAEIDREE